MTKSELARNARYKKPAIDELGYWEIDNRLDDIINDCSDVHWAADDENLLYSALDNDEDEVFEFKMMFTELEGEAYQLSEAMREWSFYEDREQEFNDCLTALIGDRFRLIGYDSYEEDYYSITAYQSELAYSEAGKRVMRLTKKEMLSRIGHTLGIVLAFQNVQLKYERLQAVFEILKGENGGILKCVKGIEEAYEQAAADNFREWSNSTQKFDSLVRELPDRFWIE